MPFGAGTQRYPPHLSFTWAKGRKMEIKKKEPGTVLFWTAAALIGILVIVNLWRYASEYFGLDAVIL